MLCLYKDWFYVLLIVNQRERLKKLHDATKPGVLLEQ